MIPDFNENGLLPPGIHLVGLEEMEERFAIFDRSDNRLRIFEQLEKFVQECRKTSIVKRVLVGGSFVTSKSEPNDFDCIVVLNHEIVGTTLRPFEYNVISRKMVRQSFGGDLLVALEGSDALNEYVSFFGTTRDGQEAGLVEVIL